MKIIKQLLLPSLLLVTSHSAFAEFGEKVNCSTQSSQVPYYSGTASCRVGVVWLDQFIGFSYSSSIRLSEYVDGQNLSCWASIPFAGYQTVTSEECDYKPVARATASASGTATTIVTASGRDFDGSIVSNKLWINGALQSSASVEGYWSEGTLLNIRARTTDNDGYTNETTTSYRVSYFCDDGPISTC